MSCGRCSRASCSAAKPSVATVASWPACLTIRRANSRLFGSSSTTRIYASVSSPVRPDALILHQDSSSVVALADRHVDGRSRRREAERVIEDVLDRRAQTLRIGVDPYRVGFRDQLQTIAIGLLHERRDEFGQIESSAIQPEAAVLELSDLKHVIGESFEVAALPAQLVNRAPLRG